MTQLDFALDRFGERIYPGDYAQCLTDKYYSIRRNERARVLAVHGECIVLENKLSPALESPYRAENFRLAGRYHPYHHNGVDKRHPRKKHLANSEKGVTNMFHIAVRLHEEEVSNMVSILQSPDSNPVVYAADSHRELKNKIEAHIGRHPNDKFLIFSANTIAETSAPPVRYRSV